jgi:DNA-directed RNA polymerase subunit RPC12/RpoP
MLRRVRHSTETEKKKAERFITNSFFVNETGRPIVLLPVSEFVENKCKVCGKEGLGMNEHMYIYCSECLSKLFRESKLVKEKVLLVPSVEQAVKGNAFEWQPQGNDNWYKVKGSSIIPNSQQRLTKKELMERYNEVMIKVLEDEPQLVDGDYQKEEKKLILLL